MHPAVSSRSALAGRAARFRPRPAFRLAAFAAAVLIVCCAASATAQDISLTNLIIDNIDGRISVRFGVEFANPFAIESALSEGAELAMVCNARLVAKRDYWLDREIGRAESISQVRKTSSGLYSINIPGQTGELTGRDFPALLAKAFDDFAMNLGPWGILKRGEAYSLSMEIRLERVNVSSWLKNSLFFWSFDAAPPARYRLDFTY
jgi:hypothetical protein